MRQYIFWCSTNGNQDDWFVQASSRFQAISCFVENYGYDEDDVKARQIMILPERFNLKKSTLLSNYKLKNLGFELVLKESPRIVRYHGRLYKEGSYIENVNFTNEYKVYLFKVTNQDYYKVGHTRNIKRRVKEILGESPFQIQVENYFITPSARYVENKIRTLFTKFIAAKEWLILDDWTKSLIGVVFELYRVEYKNNKPSHEPSNYFYAIIEELKNLIHLSKYKKRPTLENRIKLQLIYDIVQQMEVKDLVDSSQDAIAKKIKLHEVQIEDLKKELLNEHSEWKVGDNAIDEGGNRFLIEEVQTFATTEGKNEITAKFLLLVKRQLKSGRMSKRAYYTHPTKLIKVINT